MLITAANLLALRTGFRAEFQNALGAAKPVRDQIATTVPSTTASNTYGWMGQWPGFREWVGDRQLKNLASYGYAITNKDWESSVSVKRPDLEDDNIGVYRPMFTAMGEAAALHPDELLFGLLKAGESTPCYDGQNFFDTDHPVHAGNDGRGDVSTVSNRQDGTGPAWYLLDTSKALKPLIFQQRKAPVFTSMTALEDESVFSSNEFRFGADSRSNVGFGFWQQAFMSKADLNAANLNAAYAAMRGIKADGGRALDIRPTLLVVPPTLRANALEVVKAERDAMGATNVNKDLVDVLDTPWVL